MSETVTLRALERELGEENYPLERADVLDEYGDRVLDLPGGEAAVADALARVDDGESAFPDAASLVATLEAGIGGEGVGRRDYTDRGGTASGGDRTSF
ncbi:DUF5789 family protein [Halobacterium yunchengense]|uniref:DUF5789 family protein n=1 Tax=Halobacterium yunchengense TaxID=3108497 RepID=UPI0030084087